MLALRCTAYVPGGRLVAWLVGGVAYTYVQYDGCRWCIGACPQLQAPITT